MPGSLRRTPTWVFQTWVGVPKTMKSTKILFCKNFRLYSTPSLSTIVLNSRDWSEIVWLPEISRFKINLAIGFIRKKPTGMHWLGYNDAVSWLNKVKTRIFQPTANFEIFKIYLYFVCLPACRKTRLR